jgi:hypothetical protein
MPRIGPSGKGDDLKRERPPIPPKCGGGGQTGWLRRRSWSAPIRPHGAAVKVWNCYFRPALPFRGALPQTARQSHSAICAITSPNNNSAAAQTNADAKLANWKCQ